MKETDTNETDTTGAVATSTDAATAVVLTGRDLTPSLVRRVALGAMVAVDPAAMEAVRAGRAVVDRYFADGIPAYGLTTGLGARSTELLSSEAAAEFSYKTVRGRAQALGEPLPEKVVRALMVVRLNTLLTGGAGASPAVVDSLVAALNRGVVAFMPRIGSIGAADLVVMASLAHALIGEGHLVIDGCVVAAAAGLVELGIVPVVLAPKDGVVLCNNTAYSSGSAALAFASARDLLGGLQVSAALSMEGFGANLSPLFPESLRVRPQPGQVVAGDELRALLVDGPLGRPGAARRLQDPVSFRCVAQVHGAAIAALDELSEELAVDLNSPPDNPVVLLDTGLCVSTGNFHLPRLAQTVDGVARALAWCANDSVARVHRLMHAPFTGLPILLTPEAADNAGFGPLLKPLEALRAEIVHLANPVPILSSHNADGVEDTATFSALAVEKLTVLLDRLALVVAIELLAAAQAIDLRRQISGDETDADPLDGDGDGDGDRVRVRPLAQVHRELRAIAPFIGEDRPLGREIEAIARDLVSSGRIATLVGLAG